MSPIFVRF